LAENLLFLLKDIHQGKTAHLPVTVDVLLGFHQRLFDGIREHAGRVRSAHYGSEWLSFGPHRSHHRDDVPGNLSGVFDQATPLLRRLRSEPDLDDFEDAAIKVAVWLHAKIVRIHPFEDGNGRTARAMMNHVLVLLGLRPLIWETVRREYLDALNHFFTKHELEPLADLALRLYVSDIQDG
jgi:Fic family protein